MTNEMPGASGVDIPADRSGASRDPLASARAAQFLATEHWSLLATRSMSWNESFARSSMFLTSLSTATVALALVGSATDFGEAFVVFALIVLAITLFVGVATFVRLVQVNNEDLYWVAGMNRLRGIYARLEPGIEEEFVTGTTLDPIGFGQTYGAIDVTGFTSLHMFVTTPGMIGTICAVLAGVIGGLASLQVAPMAPAIGVGVLVAAIASAMFVTYARRDAEGYLARMIRFHRRPAGSGGAAEPADVADEPR